MGISRPGRREIRALLARALGAVRGADEAEAELTGGLTGLHRYAEGRPTTAVESENLRIRLRVALGRREGEAETNRLDPDGLGDAAERAVAAARLSPPNPEHVPALPRKDYPRIRAWVPGTAAWGADGRARLVDALCRLGATGGVKAAGTVSSGTRIHAFATSAGAFAYHPATWCGFSITARTPDGRGSARGSVWAARRVEDLDPEPRAAQVIERALRSRNPKPVEPGEHTVILAPDAVAYLLFWISDNLEARAAEEGRSVFAGRKKGTTRIGERVLGEGVSIGSDPTHPLLLGDPIGDEGIPQAPRTWVEDGVLRRLEYDRYWARRRRKEPTGTPWDFVMRVRGGTGGFEDLVARTEGPAILVSRFWYIRYVDRRRLLLSGVTRDGTFEVRRGRIIRPVVNLRFNESPLHVFSSIEDATEPVRGGWGLIVPGVRVRGFTFTSVSPAI